jgi:DNA-binding CsgD family transcriptional regulator
MAPGPRSVDNDAMGSQLTLDRVRSDARVLSRAGLDTATFLEEFEASVRRAIPNVAACFATLDPATRLLTGAYKFGDLDGNDIHDDEWAQHEYRDPGPGSFVDLIGSAVPACALRIDADVRRAARVNDFLAPRYGYSDELRLAACDRGIGWGAMAVFRSGDEPPFSPTEVAFAASLSNDFAIGLRAGLLVRHAGGASEAIASGPVVVIVDADNAPTQLSVGAAEVLTRIASDRNMASSIATVAGLVEGARRYAAGTATSLPRARIRLNSGQWLVLNASPMSGGAGPSGDVVVTIEEARPPEIVPLIVAAFDLSARERDVAQMVLQGVDTQQIAASLHMSRYTVQDHLKSIFDKADVRSRRDLIARVFFDQYAPRLGAELAPSGWFAPQPT